MVPLLALVPSNDLPVMHFEDAASTALGDKGCLQLKPFSHWLAALAAADDGGVCHTVWYAKINDAAVIAHEFVIEFLRHKPNSHKRRERVASLKRGFAIKGPATEILKN